MEEKNNIVVICEEVYKILKKVLPGLNCEQNFCWEKEKSYFSKQHSKYSVK